MYRSAGFGIGNGRILLSQRKNQYRSRLDHAELRVDHRPNHPFKLPDQRSRPEFRELLFRAIFLNAYLGLVWRTRHPLISVDSIWRY